MKQLILILCGWFLASGLLFPAINISSPNSSSKWEKGKQYTILWNATGTSAGFSSVSITLMNKNNMKVKTISDGTPNDGNHKWTVFTDVPKGEYKLLIREEGGVDVNYSQVFTIIDKKKGFIVANKDIYKFINKEIKFISPKSTSNWKTGSSFTVKWETKNVQGQPVFVKLYNYNGKKLIKSLGSSTTGSYQWNIPASIYKWPGYYKMYAETMGGKFKGFSDKFHISTQTAKKNYTVNGNVVNKYRYRKKKKKSFTTSCEEAPDPGAGKMRVGFNSYSSDHTDCKMIYRSFVSFNLAAYKGKGLLLKAKLKFRKFMGDNCNVKLYILDQKWNGNAKALFSVKATYHANPDNVTSIVQKWLAYPSANYGVVFVGPNENLNQYSGKCLAYYDDIKLELEFVGQK